MMTLMRNGGFPMWFIVAFGMVALGAAVRFALHPSRPRLGFVKYMSLATLMSIATGTAADLATVCYAMNSDAMAADPQWHRIFLQGMAESLSPAILGFTLLSLTALIAAVGRGRLTADD